ncbi:MAG: glycosyltransferase family 2 protein [Calditrichaeota bacterium]|nr:glycosyltransferase family 2 protein [Calditrichota bacterium]
MKISVVIPTLNEAKNIRSLLAYLKNLDSDLDLIVADADSHDGTAELAAPLAKVVPSQRRGRGAQMNAGAKRANGDIFWFIHADCFPHPDSVAALKKILSDPEVVGGAFEYSLDADGWFFRFAEFVSNHKNHVLQTFYGDMGIFVRRNVFQRMGGYKEIPLMEDMDFCTRLKKEGKIAILPLRIRTSARRWIEEGIIKNLVRNWMLQIAWKLGASAESLAKWYKF